ncbi:benzoate 4-monooxygenase cytochrome P450 [Rhexocercosporidium sp. MPI-PUGE-AT-0058]|nr:benzoate 4-monooxygenase cytochrome P450 [Rhexocercosporidium sp. MPI-PUGE-AT-0058]
MALTFAGGLLQASTLWWMRYGPVVRIAPNKLSYIDEGAWKDIHGKSLGEKQLAKSPDFMPTKAPNGAQGLVFARRDEDHARLRRHFSHGFSDKALREQQVILLKHFNIWIEKLGQQHSEPVNMMKWYQLATFDIIGDLTFGEGFGCLESSELHGWIKNVFYIVKALYVLGHVRKLFRLDKIMLWVLTSNLMPLKRNSHRELIISKIDRRIQLETSRPDLMTYVIKNMDSTKNITYDEMQMTASNFLMAGAETTAMLLAGATYYTLKNRPVYKKLKDEIRSTFTADHQITIDSTRDLSYLHAVIQEGFRMFPPVPATLPRLTPPEGHVIAGKYVAGDTTVLVNQWAAYRSPVHFREPEQFVPERWLGNSLYSQDKFGVVQPFSVGPRNCIGKHLAYAEIKLALAKLIWHFDLELAGEEGNWVDDTKIFGTFEKTPLMVRLRPVTR